MFGVDFTSPICANCGYERITEGSNCLCAPLTTTENGVFHDWTITAPVPEPAYVFTYPYTD